MLVVAKGVLGCGGRLVHAIGDGGLYLGAVLVLVMMAVGLAGCGKGGDEKVEHVLVISPHGTDIKREFADAFEAWHVRKYGVRVKVDYGDQGGTSTVNTYLKSQYKTHDTCGYDIMWGGGSANFDMLAGSEFIVPCTGGGGGGGGGVPEEVLKAIPAEAHGIALHGPKDVWGGATMSNFGIVVNKVRLGELGLELPLTWEDFAGPKWMGQLSLADPSKCGSVKTCYELVLQQYGWEKGWGVLARMFANAEAIKDGGSNPSEETALGNTAGGVVIDFFGRMAIVKNGTAVCQFVVPEGGSSLDPDPIAMLKGAPHRELAAHLMEFVLSDAGQRLWVMKPGTPGGPAHKALGRMAMLPGLYEGEGSNMTDPTNPFKGAEPLKPNAELAKQRADFLGELIKAAFIGNHEELVAARRAVAAAGDPPE